MKELLVLLWGAVACTVQVAAGSSYSYAACAPESWPGVCTAATSKEQSPINICGAEKIKRQEFEFDGESYITPDRNGTIRNVGNGIEYTPSYTNTLWLREIAYEVGRSADLYPKYTLAQFHFHWGRTLSSGSEHALFGKFYPAEVHWVHYNTKYPNLETAVQKPDGLLVVGQFVEVQSEETPVMKAIGDRVAEGIGGNPEKFGKITLSDLFNGGGDYFAYKGSLTTPTCNEVVTWVVMEDPISITRATLDTLRALKSPKTNELISKYGSDRPLQKRFDRRIYTTSGKTTPCGSFKPPVRCTVSPAHVTDDLTDNFDIRVVVAILAGCFLLLGLGAIYIHHRRKMQAMENDEHVFEEGNAYALL